MLLPSFVIDHNAIHFYAQAQLGVSKRISTQ